METGTGGKTLKVHILRKINHANYIGGDESKIVHLKLDSTNFGELTENQTYSLIKPVKFDDHTIEINSKFKPIKAPKLKLTDKTELVKELERTIADQEIGEEKDNGETFESIDKKPDNSKISKLTAKCLGTSRIITSPYGEYRIAKIRDGNNQKGDINLNKHNKNKMQVDKTYHIENFKVSNFKNDDTNYRRMATLPTTLIREISKLEEKRFSHITLGDEKAKGMCMGIGKTFGYYGCKNCWKKVEEGAKNCVKCNTPTDDKTMEFSTELYIEMDEEILTGQAFKRQLGLEIDTIVSDEIEELLEKEFTDKDIEIEYNKCEKAEEIKIIKIKKEK